MALNPLYVIASGLDEYFVDKDTGLPLANGRIEFFRDNNRSEAKDVFIISGSPPNYSYVNIGSVVELSATGTPIYNNENIVIYYYPYDSDGNLDLYYAECFSSEDVEQFTREGWPNTAANVPDGQDANMLNFVPNGQFLAHNNIPAITDNGNTAGKIYQAETNIAEGGWYFVRPSGSTSNDNISFFRFGEYVSIPSASPRYEMVYSCLAPDVSDAFKYIELRFGDVNKFASTTQQYTFAFTSETYNSANFTATLYLYKNFGSGGSPSAPITTLLTQFTVTNAYQIFQYAFTFGENTAYSIGTNNDDYVSILISVPTNISLGMKLTDVSLFQGNINVIAFPQTTNRDFMARTMTAPVPDPDGMTLGLPLIQTSDGLSYDDSQVGNIIATAKLTPSFGELMCDGATYYTNGYSSDGIPYRRLQEKIVFGAPLFGTGRDFVTGSQLGQSDKVYNFIVTNKTGAQTDTADGANPTGFTFLTAVQGQNTLGFSSYLYGAASPASGTTSNKLWAICNSPGICGTVSQGTTSFVVTVNSDQSDGTRLASADNEIQIVSVTVNSAPTAGQYFNIATPSTQYYVWFKVNGSGSDPAPGGTGILINITTTMDVKDIAYLITAALNGYQATGIVTVAGNVIPNSSYFTFFANSQKYYVWYSLNGTGTDPLVAGAIGIQVDYTAAESAFNVQQATTSQINRTCFATPDLRGYVIKGYNNGANVDLNVAYRYSLYRNNFGDKYPGTYQFDMTLGHRHQVPFFDPVGADVQANATVGDTTVQLPDLYYSSSTGTSQNDVKNMALNYIIKY